MLRELISTLSEITPHFCSSYCGKIIDLQNTLSPEEYNLSSEADNGRVAEFIAGRNCLKEALKRFRPSMSKIKRNANGAPILPNGYVGTLSHKWPFVVGLCAETSNFASVGIDIEKVDQWTLNTASIFTSPFDLQQDKVKELGITFSIYCSILFSAKESAFKALDRVFLEQKISIKELCPSITKITHNSYFFTLKVKHIELEGKIAIVDKWVLAVCWLEPPRHVV